MVRVQRFRGIRARQLGLVRRIFRRYPHNQYRRVMFSIFSNAFYYGTRSIRSPGNNRASAYMLIYRRSDECDPVVTTLSDSNCHALVTLEQQLNVAIPEELHEMVQVNPCCDMGF